MFSWSSRQFLELCPHWPHLVRFTMLIMPPSWYCALSIVFINSPRLFPSFPRSFAHCSIIASFNILCWNQGHFSDVLLYAAENVLTQSPVFHRIGFDCGHGDICHIAWSLFYHQTLCRLISRSKLRQYGESHVLLEEIAYIKFRLALLRMIDVNTYHNGHSHGARLWRNMGSWNSLHVYAITRVLPFQRGRISTWERLAWSVHLHRTLRFRFF